jgi:hypothetical protein
MKALGILFSALALLGMAGALGAATMEMANLAPADAKAIVETVDAAKLRQTLLDSKFWAALQETDGAIEWRASDRYAQMQQRLDEFLGNLKMSKKEALTTYLSGRTGVILLDSGEKKPWGVLVTECTVKNAKLLIDASGGVEEATKHGDVTIYAVQKETRVDRLAAAGGVFLATSATGNALERVLDVIAGNDRKTLADDDGYKKAVANLPEGWAIRAYAAKTPPNKNPGAVAMYVEGTSRLHFEWRIVGDQADLAAVNAPVPLTAPSVLPEKAVAAVASAFRPAAIWQLVKAKVAEQGDTAVEKLQRAEMFIRGWFPGQTMDQITAGFGPEGALALLKGDGNAAPSILGMARLADDGTAAKSFRNGLAAKAMLLAALGDQNPDTPKLNVREEVYGNAQLLIVEAPGALEKIAGDWAKDIALTVAVTDEWLIVGTAPAGVKAAIDTAAGNAPSLADDQADVLPKGKMATRWGVVQPARGADIVLALVEKLAGKATVDQARKATNLAEVMKLVKRFVWTRVDEPNVIRGEADIQATD